VTCRKYFFKVTRPLGSVAFSLLHSILVALRLDGNNPLESELDFLSLKSRRFLVGDLHGGEGEEMGGLEMMWRVRLEVLESF
jgi:hypothetical protein